MRRKEFPESAGEALRGELEQLGVAPAEAAPLAERLERLARDLPQSEYRALLDGVRLGRDALPQSGPAAPELHRILEDFAAELKKVDEGLRVLSAYLTRLRDRSRLETAPADRTLH